MKRASLAALTAFMISQVAHGDTKLYCTPISSVEAVSLRTLPSSHGGGTFVLIQPDTMTAKLLAEGSPDSGWLSIGLQEANANYFLFNERIIEWGDNGEFISTRWRVDRRNGDMVIVTEDKFGGPNAAGWLAVKLYNCEKLDRFPVTQNRF